MTLDLLWIRQQIPSLEHLLYLFTRSKSWMEDFRRTSLIKIFTWICCGFSTESLFLGSCVAALTFSFPTDQDVEWRIFIGRLRECLFTRICCGITTSPAPIYAGHGSNQNVGWRIFVGSLIKKFRLVLPRIFHGVLKESIRC